jgi:hypothetical protein
MLKQLKPIASGIASDTQTPSANRHMRAIPVIDYIVQRLADANK